MDDISTSVDSRAAKRPRTTSDGDGEEKASPAVVNHTATIVKPAGPTQALRSVLKVYVIRTEPNYAQPWQMRPQRGASGSAFVFNQSRRHILTNSHVVTNATTVHVRRPGNPKKWRAKVLCEARICDLALLTVEEEEFWAADLVDITFVDVPELQDPILVGGFPVGGDSLSITKGIVSRVVMTRYAQASNKLLAIQIDAAINSGNSGGPAFTDLQGAKVAGVAFCKLANSDNVGYIIPLKIVRHFLEEYESYSTFRGCCSVGFRWQDMENQHLRTHFKVPLQGAGSLVYKIDPLAPASEVLQENDVLMEIDGVPVADDGTVQFRNEERVEFTHIVRSKHIGEQVAAKVLREGQLLSLSYTLAQRAPLVGVLHGVDCMPSYFVVGGLVFVPLSVPFLEHAYGSSNWRKLAPVTILALITEYAQRKGEQVVILFQILAAEINFGYKFQSVRCMEFNGQEVCHLRQLAELVDSCRDEYMRFGLEGGRSVIINSEHAKRDGPNILRQHAITFDRSVDLRGLTECAQDATQADAAPTAPDESKQ